MPKNLVAKFGGTSVANAKSICQVFRIVKFNPKIKIVVVSAIGGITDLLLEYSYASKGKKKQYIQHISDIHINIVKELGLPLERIIKKKIASLKNYRDQEKLTAKDIDHIVSLGEDLSSLIVHSFFCMNNLDSHFFDIRHLLRTTSTYGKATPILNEIQKNLCLLPEGLVVTQGFIGSDGEGNTTTLGRGGSDYSAALLAEALKSKELLIYTDVDGVCSIDPFIDSQAKLISQLSFCEMKDMANFGAKILHLSTLEPCFRSKTVIKILSTFNPHLKHTSVTFGNSSLRKTGEILAITLRPQQTLVRIRSDQKTNEEKVLDKIFSLLSRYEVATDLLTINENEASFVINSTSLGLKKSYSLFSNQKLVSELTSFAKVSVEEDLTLIAVIGRNLTAKGILQQVLSLLNSIIFRLVYYEASNSSLGILVNSKDAEMIAKTLHQRFIVNQ